MEGQEQGQRKTSRRGGGNVCHLYDDFVIRAELSDEFLLLKSIKSETISSIEIIQDVIHQTSAAQILLRDEAQKILNEPNAGGASVVSEALSVEYLTRRFGARDIVTEMAIQYWFPNWKRIDYIATCFGDRIGVSVTRAMGYPHATGFTMNDAHHLCEKKLNGLVLAKSGISDCCHYEKSILHCFCQTEEISNMMLIAFHELIERDKRENLNDPTLKGSIILILTVCEIVEVYSDDCSCYQVDHLVHNGTGAEEKKGEHFLYDESR
jgi:hypothetical protein